MASTPNCRTFMRPEDRQPATSEWLTAGEAARYLKVNRRTLLMWTRQGAVKGYVLSGCKRITWRFRTVDLDATMKPPSVAECGGIQ